MRDEQFRDTVLESLADKTPKADIDMQNRIIVSIESANPEALTNKLDIPVDETTKKKFLGDINGGRIKTEDVDKAIALAIKRPDEITPGTSWKDLQTDPEKTTARMKSLIATGLGMSIAERDVITQDHLQQFLEKHPTPAKGAKAALSLMEKITDAGKITEYANASLRFMEISYGEQWKTYQQFKLLKKEAQELAEKERAEEGNHRSATFRFENGSIGEAATEEAQVLIDVINEVKNSPEGVDIEKSIGREQIKATAYGDNPPDDFAERWGLTSRTQLNISKNKAGTLLITDLSRNGISLNGKVIGGGNAKTLIDGDIISWKIGKGTGNIFITI